MIDSSTIDGNKSTFSSSLKQYNSDISAISSGWKGESANNLVKKANSFISEYQSSIESQMADFSTAASKYKEYQEKKKEYENAMNKYHTAKDNDNDSSASRWYSTASNLEGEMDDLKIEIENLLLNVSSTKFDAVDYSFKGEFVHYFQYDYPDVPYGCGSIASDGCGPTSLAMVLTHLLGREVSPLETAEKGHGKYTCADGTYWSYFGDMADEYNVNCTQMSTNKENITKNLNDGKTMIAIMGPGHFTSGGHFIVLKGLDENGKVIVADPNSEERSNQTWDMDVITSESTDMWAYDK